ncbi:MAG: lipopolysaccharide biosynthesis protein [Spiribacter salinus]|uniref:Lipopolysaccharide biosynthesis protein n=1 Tax=Spiribacter salinus TaxID=1335746 RepID=A0A540VQD9_9GAMM|nr:MAG: lipopolysaccharide biosynthesis protein [Spiribacter salinus]
MSRGAADKLTGRSGSAAGLRGDVLASVGWVAGSRMAGQAFTWVVTLVVIRLLDPADYGLMALATMLISFMLLLSELGLGPAMIQAREIRCDQLPDIFGTTLLFNAFLTALTWATAPLVASFFDEPALVDVLRVLALQFLLLAFTLMPEALLQRGMEFRSWSLGSLGARVTGSLATLVLAWYGFGVWSLVWGNLLTFVTRAAVVNWLVPCLFLPRLRPKRIIDMLRFGGHVTATRVLSFAYQHADYLIVGKLLGKDALGFYSVSYQLAAMPMQRLASIVNRVALPAFARVQTEPSLAGRHYLKAVRLVSLFGVPVMWGISSVTPEAVPLILGARWETAQVPLQIICLVIPLRMTSNLLAPALQGLGRSDVGLYNMLRVFCTMVIAFLVGAQWGIVGVAMAWALAWPSVYLFNLGRSLPRMQLRRRDLARNLARPWLAGLILYGAVAGVRTVLPESIAPSIVLPTLILAGALGYMTASLAFNRAGIAEAWDLLRRRR